MAVITRTPTDPPRRPANAPYGDRYKWTVLSNTTLGMFMATLDASIVLISLPAIFRGIHLDPLAPANVSYLLWLLMGYMVVTAVLVVTFGKLGDMFGRVRMYNGGFAVFTVASIALSLTPGHGGSAAMFMIIMRVVQGIGGALLMANSTAILTDAFPVDQRGTALGISMIAGIAGSFIGLVLGGVLADVDWRLVFWVNVPFGVFGTVWAYLKLKEISKAHRGKLDVWGNITFGVGLVLVLIGITYGIQPYKQHTMGWTGPWVLLELISGTALLALFVAIELRAEDPMFRLSLFGIRAFTAGNAANLLSAIGRGGVQFILILWLQGIWLPQHGYNFEQTPLWAGIYMLPITAGFLLSAPISGFLSDKYGARTFATGGMLTGALSFVLLEALPANFSYPVFALVLLLNGIAFGLFAAPNTTAIMNSVPVRDRGAASGMSATFRNSGMVLSIGLFFSLMIVGLASSLPRTLYSGLTAQGLDAHSATSISHLPPVALLFAAFLGYNPMKTILGPRLHSLSASAQANVTGRSFFPHLISSPFMHGLRIAFTMSVGMCLVAAACSALRGTPAVADDDAVPFDAADAVEAEVAPA
ncbi:MAG TPA: MFS transporter [Acidimicrobiales bacterium]|nr:MFS transporter [Acidimicrobiales bacterium]